MRAVFGSRSGPITISATTAMTTISEKPTSNMEAIVPFAAQTLAAWAGGCGAAFISAGRLHLVSRVLAHFAFDGGARDLRRRLGRRRGVGFAALHPFLEALHRPTQILAHVAQLLRAEDEHDDQQDDQPMPD